MFPLGLVDLSLAAPLRTSVRGAWYSTGDSTAAAAAAAAVRDRARGSVGLPVFPAKKMKKTGLCHKLTGDQEDRIPSHAVLVSEAELCHMRNVVSVFCDPKTIQRRMCGPEAAVRSRTTHLLILSRRCRMRRSGRAALSLHRGFLWFENIRLVFGLFSLSMGGEIGRPDVSQCQP